MREISLGLIQLGLIRPWVDGKQELTNFDIGAVREVNSRNPTGNLGLNRNHFPGDDLTHRIDVNRHILSNSRSYRDGSWRPLDSGIV